VSLRPADLQCCCGSDRLQLRQPVAHDGEVGVGEAKAGGRRDGGELVLDGVLTPSRGRCQRNCRSGGARSGRRRTRGRVSGQAITFLASTRRSGNPAGGRRR
jgi:hypothetical protein